MSKAFVKQFCFCLLAGSVVYIAENVSGSRQVAGLVEQNGFVLLAAVFALSITSLSFILSRITYLEETRGNNHIFDLSKKAAMESLNEQALSLALFLLLMAITPKQEVYNSSLCRYFWLYPVAVVQRATIIFTLYASFDAAKAMIKSCVFPEN